MTNNDVHSAIVRWIASMTGLVTIKAHQSGKAPSLPYCMVNLTGAVEVRKHAQDIEYVEADEPLEGEDFPIVTAHPVIEMEWRFSIHVYGNNPSDYFRPMISAIKMVQPTEVLEPLSVHEFSQVRIVPDWINESWQPRAQADLSVRGLVKDGHEVFVAEEIPFDIQEQA